MSGQGELRTVWPDFDVSSGTKKRVDGRYLAPWVKERSAALHSMLETVAKGRNYRLKLRKKDVELKRNRVLNVLQELKLRGS